MGNTTGGGGLVVATAASGNHACSLVGLLRSLHSDARGTRVVVYDLNVQPPHLLLEPLRKANPAVIEVRRFPYAEYPPHFRVDRASGQWAWKAAIIKAAVDEFGEVVWMDAGSRVAPGRKRGLSVLQGAMERGGGFASPISRGSQQQWVHAGTYAFLGLEKCCRTDGGSNWLPCCCCGNATSHRRCEAECPQVQGRPPLVRTQPAVQVERTMCNGALIAMARDSPAYDAVLIPWFECALDERCIAPTYPRHFRANRGNHRQDQAALSLLASIAGYRCSESPRDLDFFLHREVQGLEGVDCDALAA